MLLFLSINISKLTARAKDSISRRTSFWKENRGNLFSFPCTLICSKLNSIAMCLCNKELDFRFLLNRLAVYFLPTAMNSLRGNHTMHLFHLLKENFKNLLFDLLITGRSFENLHYLSSCSLSQRWRFPIINKSV